MNWMKTIEVLLAVTLRMSPPLILAGLGGAISARVGLLNMALEGMMLMGCFSAVIISYATGSSILGMVSAAIVGAIFAYLLALGVLKFNADNIVVCVGINILALGLTTYLLKAFFGVRGAFSSPKIVGLPVINIPVIESIPVLKAFSGQSILVYISIIGVFVIHYIMYQTPVGLHMRAAGNHDMAVVTAGINISKLKYFTIISSGILSGLGGAHLSLGQLTMFTENMTNNRGFMAMAASIFGNRTPIGTFIGAMIFSFADGLSIRLQSLGYPPQLLQMVPFILTLLTLLIVAIRKNRKKPLLSKQK